MWVVTEKKGYYFLDSKGLSKDNNYNGVFWNDYFTMVGAANISIVMRLSQY
jgi:hypothetical protein